MNKEKTLSYYTGFLNVWRSLLISFIAFLCFFVSYAIKFIAHTERGTLFWANYWRILLTLKGAAHCFTMLLCAFISFDTLWHPFIPFDILSYAFKHFNMFSNTFMCFQTLSFVFNMLSYAFICFHTLSYAFIRFHNALECFYMLLYMLYEL